MWRSGSAISNPSSGLPYPSRIRPKARYSNTASSRSLCLRSVGMLSGGLPALTHRPYLGVLALDDFLPRLSPTQPNGGSSDDN